MDLSRRICLSLNGNESEHLTWFKESLGIDRDTSALRAIILDHKRLVQEVKK